jgi:hypothetical protein
MMHSPYAYAGRCKPAALSSERGSLVGRGYNHDLLATASPPLSHESSLGFPSGHHLRKVSDALANGSERFSSFAERLLNQFHKLFLFTRYLEVECTNNAVERTLRHIVLWRKTSYGTQSDSGSRFIERAVSIWMTLKKQGREVLPYFEQAYRATFQPNIPAPIIVPL